MGLDRARAGNLLVGVAGDRLRLGAAITFELSPDASEREWLAAGVPSGVISQVWSAPKKIRNALARAGREARKHKSSARDNKTG
jgi:hypothetical protein